MATVVRISPSDLATPEVVRISDVVGPRGPGGSGATYTHSQASASTVWTVDHNLGVLTPSVILVDDTGADFEADIDFVTTNQLTVNMTTAVAGTAYIRS